MIKRKQKEKKLTYKRELTQFKTEQQITLDRIGNEREEKNRDRKRTEYMVKTTERTEIKGGKKINWKGIRTDSVRKM